MLLVPFAVMTQIDERSPVPRAKAIRVWSCDQDGSRSSTWFRVNWRCCEPSALTTKISWSARLRALAKRSVSPSGAHAGPAVIRAGFSSLTLWRPLPSQFAT